MNTHGVDHELAEWLAAQTHTDAAQVIAELEAGERRRELVADELIEAGFTGAELLGLLVRLTGLEAAEARTLIDTREGGRRARRQQAPSARDVRLAENEILFRQVNERLVAAAGAAGPREHLLICECSDRGCLAKFTMSAAEYAWLRQNPRRFVVLPGHEAPAVEDVVERHARFLIVEKHPATHELVEAADPRSA